MAYDSDTFVIKLLFDGTRGVQNIYFLPQVEKGEIPETDALIDLKPVFVDKPFGLDYLTKVHKIHSVSNSAHVSESCGM